MYKNKLRCPQSYRHIKQVALARFKSLDSKIFSVFCYSVIFRYLFCSLCSFAPCLLLLRMISMIVSVRRFHISYYLIQSCRVPLFVLYSLVGPE
uniref:Uncharacterized protein n=1 Tax=Oryza brachyantha TaxID=4533 RepID=J3MZD6_ORYBR